MKFQFWKFVFANGSEEYSVTTHGMSYEECKILAQADAIRRGYDWTIKRQKQIS